MNQEIAPTAVLCFTDGKGGLDFDAIKLARLLSGSGAVSLICRKGSYIEEYCLASDYSFALESISFRSRTFSPTMLIQVRRFLKRRKIKNVVFFGASELKTLYFSFLGLGLNVCVRHGTTKNHPKTDMLHTLIYSCVNYHVSISRHLINNVKTIVPQTRGVGHKIIYPSFQVPGNQDNKRKKDGPIRLIHVGRIVRGKGQVDAVRACKLLNDNGIEFELKLLGASDDQDELDRLNKVIASVPYDDSIDSVGHVDNVNDYLLQSDAFLYPSYGEGFGNVFAEAMLHGLPTITYDNTTFPEFRSMGFEFTMVEHGNIDLLGDALYQLVLSLDSLSRICSSNLELAKQMFSEEKELACWKEILI